MIVDDLDRLPGRLQRGEIDFMILTKFEPKESLEKVVLGTERNVVVQKEITPDPMYFWTMTKMTA